MDTPAETGLTVDVGGVATHYHDQGDGPVVVLVHGSGPGVSAWANWRTVLPALAQDFRVVAPDVLGFGSTQRPDGVTYDLPTWLDHLTGFLDALGLDRVHLVGNSFGGALALALATRAPGRVDRLVLMGSVGVPFDLTPGLESAWGFEPSVPAMRRLLETFAYDVSRIDDDLVAVRLAAATRPGVQEAFASMFPAPRQQGVDALVVDEAAVRALPHETLLVHGRDDRVIPLATSLRLLELLDRAQLHVFPRCGHWVQIEQNARFVALVRAFLSEAG